MPVNAACGQEMRDRGDTSKFTQMRQGEACADVAERLDAICRVGIIPGLHGKAGNIGGRGRQVDAQDVIMRLVADKEF